MEDKSNSSLIKWGIHLSFSLVILLPFIRWGEVLNWDFSNLTLFEIFPLLGLWAFSIMWLHFAVGIPKRYWPNAYNYKSWYRWTSNIVLVLILSHPTIIFFNMRNKGLTVTDYVGDMKKLFIFFAYFALTTFLIYEVADRTRKHPITKKYWQIIKGFNMAAFVAIFYHGFNVGQHLQAGWLRNVWIFYGVSTAIFLLHAWYWDIKNSQESTKSETQ